MADVLIVCVREDEPQAKALAEMFEAAGFSIGGAPSSDAALRSSGAGVIVWSQASIRSRPFLDAAQRVINAGKAVVASLIEPPPPSSIGDAPAFDLSQWPGDPDDPGLDPLFFAVDRMVTSARAAVGAPAAQPAPAPFDPPPSLRPQPSARPAARAPIAPAPAPAPQQSGDLGDEAAHWRSIRNSRDPAAFMDYLARYGPDGAFADVAELRLKELASSGGAPRPAPAPTLRPEVTRRPEPPPRRPDPPQRRAEPPPAAAAPPQRRRDPPPPQTYERRYERNEVRDPPRAEGGALRAFVLIALLGGAALAGALYFGGGLGDNAPQEEEQYAAPSAPPSEEPPGAEGLEQTGATPFQEAARAPQRPEPRREQQQQQQQRREEPEAPTPAPVTNWASNTPTTGGGGPVSLAGPTTAPPTEAPASAPPLPPPSVAPAPAATAPPRPAGTVQWTQRPSARIISELYPARAMRDGVGGRVELDCTVLGNLSLACSVASESPAGQGFGRAALGAANSYRARATLSNGASSVGTRTRIVVQFQAPAQ